MQELESILDSPNEMADMYLARRDAAMAEAEVKSEQACSMKETDHVLTPETAASRCIATRTPCRCIRWQPGSSMGTAQMQRPPSTVCPRHLAMAGTSSQRAQQRHPPQPSHCWAEEPWPCWTAVTAWRQMLQLLPLALWQVMQQMGVTLPFASLA